MNIQTQKGLGLPIILAIIAIVLVVGAVMFTRNQPVEEQAPTREEAEVMGKEEHEAMMTEEIIVPLMAQNDSGESGTAVITKIDGQTKVALSLTGAPATTPQPAHIHVGSCATLGGVDHALASVVNGSSETVLDIPITHILEHLPLAINVHKSVAQVGVYVACGDIVPE